MATNRVDAVDELLQTLRDNLRESPGNTTDIGWQRWSDEEDGYYAEVKAKLNASLVAARIDEWKRTPGPYLSPGGKQYKIDRIKRVEKQREA